MSDQRNPIITKLRTEGEFLPYAKPAKSNQIKQSPTGRHCTCGARLSIYNHRTECGPCQEKSS